MDVPALIAHALSAVNGNQAELARQLGRSETTVSRWVAGRNGIDYESALRIARITRIPAETVIAAAGLDPSLLPSSSPPDLSPMERDLLARIKRVEALVDASDGLPDDFVGVYVAKQLDKTEDEIRDTIKMVMRVRAVQAAHNNGARTASDNDPEQAPNESEDGPPPGLRTAYRGRDAGQFDIVTHLPIDLWAADMQASRHLLAAING